MQDYQKPLKGYFILFFNVIVNYGGIWLQVRMNFITNINKISITISSKLELMGENILQYLVN